MIAKIIVLFSRRVAADLLLSASSTDNNNDTTMTTTIKLTAKQSALLDLVTQNQGLNTHRLAVLRGDKQAYESQLKSRLCWLESKGLIRREASTRQNLWFAA